MANALVGVLSDRSRWSAELQTDADGIARSEAWERGDFVFAVRTSAESAPSLLPDRIEGQSHARIDLHLSERIVEGHLFDGDNGVAVANARVELESANDDGTTAQMVARTDSEGAFAFEGLHDGTQAIVADASSYIRSDPTKVHVDAATPRRSIRINVSHGVARPLRITTRGGVPIRNATVIAIVGSDVSQILKTDETGATTLHTPPQSSPVVYVMPVEGSLAIARLASTPSERAESIIVPDGTATLELHANDLSGKPLPRVRFAIRYEGEMIPQVIADFLEIRRGLAQATGADGVARLDRLPAGYFELWPVRTRAESDAIFASGMTAAPVQVTLRDGVNYAKMTFARK